MIEFETSEEQLQMDESEMRYDRRYSGILNLRSSDLDKVIREKSSKGFNVEKITLVSKISGYFYNVIFSRQSVEPKGFEFRL